MERLDPHRAASPARVEQGGRESRIEERHVQVPAAPAQAREQLAYVALRPDGHNLVGVERRWKRERRPLVVRTVGARERESRERGCGAAHAPPSSAAGSRKKSANASDTPQPIATVIPSWRMTGWRANTSTPNVARLQRPVRSTFESSSAR